MTLPGNGWTGKSRSHSLYDGAKLKQDASVVIFALHHEVWLLQGHEQSHSICRLQVMAIYGHSVASSGIRWTRRWNKPLSLLSSQSYLLAFCAQVTAWSSKGPLSSFNNTPWCRSASVLFYALEDERAPQAYPRKECPFPYIKSRSAVFSFNPFTPSQTNIVPEQIAPKGTTLLIAMLLFQCSWWWQYIYIYNICRSIWVMDKTWYMAKGHP